MTHPVSRRRRVVVVVVRSEWMLQGKKVPIWTNGFLSLLLFLSPSFLLLLLLSFFFSLVYSFVYEDLVRYCFFLLLSCCNRLAFFMKWDLEDVRDLRGFSGHERERENERRAPNEWCKSFVSLMSYSQIKKGKTEAKGDNFLPHIHFLLFFSQLGVSYSIFDTERRRRRGRGIPKLDSSKS